jgi:hypothetical protein
MSFQASTDILPQPPKVVIDEPVTSAEGEIYTRSEMRRVGTAAMMLVVGGYVIIIGITMAMGFYSSLAHSGPKAVLDGAVVGLLLLNKGRWRCWTLVGLVYAFSLLLLLGNPYVFAVIAMAALIGSGFGRVTEPLFGRTVAVAVTAVMYEVLAGFGMPIRILLSTDGREPILWNMWFAEWPLRIAGALVGVSLAVKFLRRRATQGPREFEIDAREPAVDVPADLDAPARRGHPGGVVAPRARGIRAAGVRVAMSLIACFLPVMIERWSLLGLVALVYVIYAFWAGLKWRGFYALLGLLYGWAVFAGASYLWHQDWHRSFDMLRTFALRFAPLALASTVLATTVRPVDMVRLLRRCFIPGVIVLPLSHVLRGIPQSRREFGQSIARLRRDGTYRGPLSILRRPRAIARGLLGPQFRRWADQLAE